MIELEMLTGVGFGCHFINTVEAEHEKALLFALESGCKIIDTSSNYQHGMAEELLGKVLKNKDRSEYFLMSKGGSLSGEILARFNQTIKEQVPENEIVHISGQHYHCIHPRFLQSQIEQSLSAMNQSFLDGYFLHNPEYFLESSEGDINEFYRRISNAFKFLEKQVKEGKIRYYGISESSGKVDIKRLIEIAQDISPKHHFKLMQFPYNVALKPILDEPNGADSLKLLKDNGIVAFGNRPITARIDGKSFRLVSRELHKIEKKQVLTLMDAAFYALEQYAESLSEPVDISESQIIQYVYSSWENFLDDTTFDAIVDQHLTPYLLSISKGQIDETVAREMNAFTSTLSKYIQDKVTLRSRDLMTELGYQETYKKPDGIIELCQEYFSEGIDVVLCGMKRVKYVEQLKPLF